MEDKLEFLPYLTIWLVVLAFVVWLNWTRFPRRGVGLVLSYCFQLWLLYWVGAVIHALPWSELPNTGLVFLGLQQSTYALVAFVVGSLAGSFLIQKRSSADERPVTVPDARLPWTYVISGMACYGILLPTIGRLPSLMALTAVGQQLVVVGCCLKAWQVREDTRKLLRWLAVCFLLPAATTITHGFLGYGAIALATVMIFVAQFYRRRWSLMAVFLLIAYAGLSFYTVYMRDRIEIRASVWGGQSLTNRVDRFLETVFSTQPFDPHNQEHLQVVDDRLNQAMLVGAAVVHLEATGDFANGQTVWGAVLGLVPRALWPEKPVFGGSGAMVSRFTGLEFAPGTSVGVGPVLEFYANFATPGILMGFFLIGALLGFIDLEASGHLQRGYWQEFAVWFLVGISFLQVSGSLVEVSSSAIASVVLGIGIKLVLHRFQGKRTPAAPAPLGWSRMLAGR